MENKSTSAKKNDLRMANNYCKYGSLPSELDIPINSILVNHDPDGRTLDSETLLQVIRTIMHHPTESQAFLDVSITEEFEAELDNAICMISNEILRKCYEKETSHEITLDVLNLLGRYRWDEKLLLTLTAFATQYGQFWVILQSKDRNSLAASIALIKQFSCNSEVVKPVCAMLVKLVDSMIEIITSIAQFEGLPIAYLELQSDDVAITKKRVYLAAYWLIKSIVQCVSLVLNLRSISENTDEQEFRDQYSVSRAIWEITSLKSKISNISTELRELVNFCQKQTDKEVHNRLVNLLQETHSDNQDVLRIMFALQNDLPLKRSTEQPKVGISSLKNKVIILLISRPKLLPIEELLLLIQQTYDHPFNNKLNGSYALLWIPISDSNTWSNNDMQMFSFLSNSMPWYSVSQPWLLSSATIKYAKEEWKFNEPVMVVLDSLGKISNINASDMIWTWGAKAYPFSSSREKELWEDENWGLRLLLDNIDPLLTILKKDGQFAYTEAVKDFTEQVTDIQTLLPELAVVYVGKKDQAHPNSSIISVIKNRKLSKFLSLTKTRLFWNRLESMRRSKLNLGYTSNTDHTLKEIEALLTNDEEWVIIGSGSETNMVRFTGNEWVKFMGQSSSRKNYMSEIGLVNAIGLWLQPHASEPCSHPRIVEYNEGLMEETFVCEKCKRLIKKFVMYDPE